jgi:outer membrane protein assembly factor BamE
MSALTRHGARRVPILMPAALLASALLGGCGSFDRAVKLIDPYKNDVVQGNFVSKEQVEFIKPGMTRQQVRDVLGTPLVASVFHEDRWDYVFTLERRGVEMQRYRLTVYFTGDTLDRVVGDTMPTEAEFVARFDAVKKTVKVPLLQASDEDLGKYPVTEAAVAAPPGGVTPGVYPPLE